MSSQNGLEPTPETPAPNRAYLPIITHNPEDTAVEAAYAKPPYDVTVATIIDGHIIAIATSPTPEGKYTFVPSPTQGIGSIVVNFPEETPGELFPNADTFTWSKSSELNIPVDEKYQQEVFNAKGEKIAILWRDPIDPDTSTTNGVHVINLTGAPIDIQLNDDTRINDNDDVKDTYHRFMIHVPASTVSNGQVTEYSTFSAEGVKQCVDHQLDIHFIGQGTTFKDANGRTIQLADLEPGSVVKMHSTITKELNFNGGGLPGAPEWCEVPTPVKDTATLKPATEAIVVPGLQTEVSGKPLPIEVERGDRSNNQFPVLTTKPVMLPEFAPTAEEEAPEPTPPGGGRSAGIAAANSLFIPIAARNGSFIPTVVDNGPEPTNAEILIKKLMEFKKAEPNQDVCILNNSSFTNGQVDINQLIKEACEVPAQKAELEELFKKDLTNINALDDVTANQINDYLNAAYAYYNGQVTENLAQDIPMTLQMSPADAQKILLSNISKYIDDPSKTITPEIFKTAMVKFHAAIDGGVDPLEPGLNAFFKFDNVNGLTSDALAGQYAASLDKYSKMNGGSLIGVENTPELGFSYTFKTPDMTPAILNGLNLTAVYANGTSVTRESLEPKIKDLIDNAVLNAPNSYLASLKNADGTIAVPTEAITSLADTLNGAYKQRANLQHADRIQDIKTNISSIVSNGYNYIDYVEPGVVLSEIKDKLDPNNITAPSLRAAIPANYQISDPDLQKLADALKAKVTENTQAGKPPFDGIENLKTGDSVNINYDTTYIANALAGLIGTTTWNTVINNGKTDVLPGIEHKPTQLDLAGNDIAEVITASSLPDSVKASLLADKANVSKFLEYLKAQPDMGTWDVVKANLGSATPITSITYEYTPEPTVFKSLENLFAGATAFFTDPNAKTGELNAGAEGLGNKQTQQAFLG